MLIRRLAVIAAFLSLAAVAAPVSAATLYCFCTMPSTPQYGSCGGKMVHMGPVADAGTCANTCTSAGLESGSAVDDYNAGPCDWQYQGNTCLGPNKAQNNATCQTERANWEKAGTAAKDQALGGSAKGSTIGLTLPLSDVSPQQVIGRLIKALLGIVGSLALLMFLYGGFRWMISRGNAEQVTKAKQTIVWATLGLVVIFAAYAIVSTLVKGISGQ